MNLTGAVVTAPDGLRGFDCDVALTRPTAKAFHGHGYRFAVRYVRRNARAAHDISAQEAKIILDAGLGLMIVQYVAPDGWLPSAKLGTSYGAIAAEECRAVGYLHGATLWCDLEGTNNITLEEDAIHYANAWFDSVAAAGFIPGLYVGFHAGIGHANLYHKTKFQHYWSAYNLNADQHPAVRDVQMKQSAYPGPFKGVDFEFDVNTIHADKLGGLPTMMAPTGWKP